MEETPASQKMSKIDLINDLETISSYIREHNTALSIVDCVTSLGACNVPVDKWKLDIVASGSQKDI